MRRSRYVWIAGAVVVTAAVLFLVLRPPDRTAPVASPTASASVAVSSPTASPSASPCLGPCGPTGPASAAPGAIFNDDFGFIVVRSGNATIRKESSDEFSGPLFNAQAFAVSPDGKRIAYFKRGPGQNGEGAELRVFSAGSNSTEQTLVTLGAEQRGGGIAWSSDGAGLVYSTETGSFGIGGGTNRSSLNIYELDAAGRHGTPIDQQNNTGWLYRPVAWDRSANVAAAALTGDGGFMGFYVTVRLNADSSFNVQRAEAKPGGMVPGSVRASGDAKLVLGVDSTSGDLKWWPLADFAATKSQPGAGKRGALWRPGTHEIGFMSGDQFWLGDVDRAGALGLCCTAFSGAPTDARLLAFRADGSAVVLVGLVAPPGSPTVRQTQFTLVRLGSDPKATSGDRVTLNEIDLVGSVRFR